MNVLVACASKHGATAEIATALARDLCAHRLDVDVRSAEEVDGVGEYDAAVLGSAVYMGRWLPAAIAVVELYADELAKRPVWLFSSGPLGDTPSVDPKEIAEFQAAIHPRGHRTFVGSLDRHDLSFTERMIVKAVKAPDGDFRDWDDINTWAESIAQALMPAGTPPISTHDTPPAVSHPLQP